MKEELSKRIEKKFPFMNREILESDNNYKRFGFELGDGWFSVIWGLCEEITAAYNSAGKEIDLIPVQCKSKFGTLRFYYDVNGENKAIHAFDFIGESSVRLQNRDSELYSQIADIVGKWEERSSQVCEKCGNTGKLRTDIGWIRTLCDECYQNIMNK